MRDNYRSKFVSVVIQPKMETTEFWLSNPTDKKINDKLIEVSFPSNLEYCFTVIPESFEFYCEKYKDFPWFMELVENGTRFEKFKLTPEYERQKYESRLISKWVTNTSYNLQSDILSVYYKALAYSSRRSNQKFIEASSTNNSIFKVYSVKNYFNLLKKKRL